MGVELTDFLFSIETTTNNKKTKKWLPTNLSRSKRCSPKPKSKTDLCPSGSDSRPVTRSDTTLRGDTGREPSWVCKYRVFGEVHYVNISLFCQIIIIILYLFDDEADKDK